jgi:NAD(P)-dependent dehydrogenase (short-subunit alcohol dehydrogenase family)
MLLANKVALIVGGAKGMGRSTAVSFAEQGCDVAIADIGMDDAMETVRLVQKTGRKSLALECDNTDSTKVRAVVEQVVAKFGTIDILVNTAGGITLTPGSGVAPGKEVALNPSAADVSDAEWDRIVSVNLKGSFFFCRAVVPLMKKKRYGKIINVSSIGAVYPPDVLPHYHAAKAGVLGMTKDLACELAPFNITVNAIMPGPFRTQFFDKMLTGQSDQEKKDFFNFLGSSTPMQRVGESEEISGPMLFFASDLSSYVTGAALPVAGGLPLAPNGNAAANAKASD